MYIPGNEYFEIGQLDLSLYREKLHCGLQSVADSIFNNLSSQHLWEINDICDCFQLIRARALQVPVTTEELIEIGLQQNAQICVFFLTDVLLCSGKFMAWIKNEQLESLNERVQTALASLCDLIVLGLLNPHHIDKNTEGTRLL